MKWRVFWMNRTRKELAKSFLAARAAGRDLEFVQALDRIDARLTRRPDGIGESRGKDHRLYVDLPVLVEYEINEIERAVFVVRVHYVPFRGPSPSNDDLSDD